MIRVLKQTTALLGSGVLLAALSPSLPRLEPDPTPLLSFQIGPGAIPPGATQATFDVWDDDVKFDDQLEAGLGQGELTPGGGWTSDPLSSLFCEGGVVTGGFGGSGEGEAEIYLVVQFRDADNKPVGDPVTTGVKPTSCDGSP